MFEADQYALLDFGAGARLERFGARILARPAPAAAHLPPRDPDDWSRADASFERPSGDSGRWSVPGGELRPWIVSHGCLKFELRLTPFGHVGLFPEQAANWDWIAARLRTAPRPVKVLNLFGYTGGSTLAAAAAGAEVVHVDAARNVVNWARRNAELSGLGSAPIRWIAEDARKFVARELKRGHRYNGVILDPPTYGHGAKGEAWRIHDDLAPLIAACAELLTSPQVFFVLTCHSPGLGPPELEALVSDSLPGKCQSGVEARSLLLRCADGRRLPCGAGARWPQ